MKKSTHELNLRLLSFKLSMEQLFKPVKDAMSQKRVVVDFLWKQGVGVFGEVSVIRPRENIKLKSLLIYQAKSIRETVSKTP